MARALLTLVALIVVLTTAPNVSAAAVVVRLRAFRIGLAAVVTLILAVGPTPALAATKTFTGAIDSSWTNGGNWNPSGVPGSGDDVVINSGTVHLTGADGNARSLSINTASPFTGGLSVDDHTLTVSPSGTSFIDGFLGIGSSASVDLGDPTTFAGSADSNGINVGGPLNISSTFTITGADGDHANVNKTGGSGIINVLSGGSLVRDTSTGTVTVDPPVDNDGTASVKTGTLALAGGDAGSTSGSYDVSTGATLRVSGTFESPTVSGAGTLDVAGGTTTVGTTDVFTISGLGIDNNGTFTLNKDVSIPTLISTNGHRNGTGALTVTGTADFAGLFLDTGTTTVAASVTGFTIGHFLQVGSTGGVTPNATLNLDAPTGYPGSADSNGINLFGGVVNIASSFTLGGAGITGAVNDDGGVNLIHVLSTGSLTRSGNVGTVAVGPPVTSDGTIAAQTGVVSFSGGLTQSGGSTTTVSSGAELDGAITLGGGTLAGAGIVGGPVTNTGGTVAPGSSPGTLTITGDYTQGAGGTLQVDVDGTTAGSQFDLLAVGGATTLDGTVAVVQGGGFAPQNGDTFQFLTFGSRTGQFATLSGGTIAGGGSYSLDYITGAARLVVGIAAPANNTKPTISGGSVVGQTLTCSPGSWSDNPSFGFEWLRDGTPIASGTQYVLVAGDAGHAISCRVTATNGGGSSQASSDPVNATAPVVVSKPASTAAPSVPGTGRDGDSVTCQPGGWTGSPAFTFAWLRDGAVIAGASGQTYKLTSADAGHAIVCRVTATNSAGSTQASSGQLVVELEKPAPAPPTTCGSGAAGGNSVCLQGPSDLQKFGCLRIGNFQHRFPVALKKKVKGVTVNRLSRVTVVIFTLDGKPNGQDRTRPFFAVVNGLKLTPGKHTLHADVRLQVPKTKKKFRKQFSFPFNGCG